MNATQNNRAIRDLRTLFGVGALGALSDGQLLDRFVARRDEAAFEALMVRHGPMVWGVCCRVLRNHHDAEDALQATFLVLARKAPSIVPRELLANWLYGVAYHTALKTRTTRTKRIAREKPMIEMPESETSVRDQGDQVIPLLDQELTRLPDKYRTPIILCELEGKTHKDAALQLGWPIGTLSGRLSRARGLLRKRLLRRGLMLPVRIRLSDGVSNCVSASVLSPTIRAAGMIAAGQKVSAGLVSSRVLALSEEVVKAMLLKKLGILALVVALAATTSEVVIRTHGSESVDRRHGDSTPRTILLAQDGNHAAPKPRDARATAEAFAIALSEGNLKDAARLCWPEERDEARLLGLKKALDGTHPAVESVDTLGNVALALSVKMKLPAEAAGDNRRAEIEARLMLVLCRKEDDWQIQLFDLGPALDKERDRSRFRIPFQDPGVRERLR